MTGLASKLFLVSGYCRETDKNTPQCIRNEIFGYYSTIAHFNPRFIKQVMQKEVKLNFMNVQLFHRFIHDKFLGECMKFEAKNGQDDKDFVDAMMSSMKEILRTYRALSHCHQFVCVRDLPKDYASLFDERIDFFNCLVIHAQSGDMEQEKEKLLQMLYKCLVGFITDCLHEELRDRFIEFVRAWRANFWRRPIEQSTNRPIDQSTNRTLDKLMSVHQMIINITSTCSSNEDKHILDEVITEHLSNIDYYRGDTSIRDMCIKFDITHFCSDFLVEGAWLMGTIRHGTKFEDLQDLLRHIDHGNVVGYVMSRIVGISPFRLKERLEMHIGVSLNSIQTTYPSKVSL